MSGAVASIRGINALICASHAALLKRNGLFAF
jgi:hypothetical protein